MSSLETFISFRYLRGKRRIGTYVTAVGICLGSFVLIIALSIANGFEKEVRDRIVGTNAHANILQYHSTPVIQYDSLREVILNYPEVLGAAPYISGKGGIEHQQIQEGVRFMGVDHNLEPTVTDLGKTVKWGRFNLDSAEIGPGRSCRGSVSGLVLPTRWE
jgi:lipoprotein-releasing system permease protein